MAFNIIYVEDDHHDYRSIEKAIKKYNEANLPATEPLKVSRAHDPEDLRGKLDFNFDVVLADIYFDDRNCLSDIIKYIKDWGVKKNSGRPLPIIAYSARASLIECLKNKNELYDIWDKNTTTPEFVAWRLSKLAVELTHFQPDSKLQSLIRDMPCGASWHNQVIEMAEKYNSGWTEHKQIIEAGKSIQRIARALGVWEECEPMWRLMTDWEFLGRAISHTTRGHARHAINVFWLGYYFIHHKLLGN